jgi:hypothetical protein
MKFWALSFTSPGAPGNATVELEWTVRLKVADLKQHMDLHLQTQNIVLHMDVPLEQKHNTECVCVDFRHQVLLQKMKRHPVAQNVRLIR